MVGWPETSNFFFRKKGQFRSHKRGCCGYFPRLISLNPKAKGDLATPEVLGDSSTDMNGTFAVGDVGLIYVNMMVFLCLLFHEDYMGGFYIVDDHSWYYVSCYCEYLIIYIYINVVTNHSIIVYSNNL